MSRKFEREEKEIERLQKDNRELKSENRTLRRRLKQLNKGYRKLEEDEIITSEDIPPEIKKICWDCSIGNYNEVIIGNRRFRRCDNCHKTGKVTLLDKAL